MAIFIEIELKCYYFSQKMQNNNTFVSCHCFFLYLCDMKNPNTDQL